jgi:hypothetical protein
MKTITFTNESLNLVRSLSIASSPIESCEAVKLVTAPPPNDVRSTLAPGVSANEK